MLSRAMLLAAALMLSVSACERSVCQQFVEHQKACRYAFCTVQPDNPICAGPRPDRHARRCPAALRPMAGHLLQMNCRTLARELGWEALGELPLGPP